MEWEKREVYYSETTDHIFEVYSYQDTGVTRWGWRVAEPWNGEEIHNNDGFGTAELAIQEAENWLKEYEG